MKVYDALVIGGGPAGATATLLLARAGWSVAVVERERFPRRKVCGEFISAATWQLLRELGLADALASRAGPAVREVGIYAGKRIITAPMPPYLNGAEPYGRAIAREDLDACLLEHARAAGADVWQPWTVTAVRQHDPAFVCTLVDRHTQQTTTLSSRLMIAAHGSWLRGSLPTQTVRPHARASELFAFKAHLADCDLRPGLMPLLAFPGGYGGMVCTSGSCATLSCCIRRDRLEQCRRAWPGVRAGDAVFRHIIMHCRGALLASERARVDGAWLSAGPIRPGVRACCRDGVYVIGNAAGEAHPIVAEGISMAIQSAWLLCERLLAEPDALSSRSAAARAGSQYEKQWRGQFGMRMRAAALYAHLAMSRFGAAMAPLVLSRMPPLLTWGARYSGKVHPPA